MWILTLFLGVVFLGAAYAGNQNWFTLDRLSQENVLNGALIAFALFTLLMVAYVLGFFPQSIAAPFMMFLYILISGFFCGYGIRLLKVRSEAGGILYQYRSFWIDHAPNFLAIILIIYGIFRTAVLTDLPVTGIRITSGLSLMSFGFFAWTLKAVPEFRSKGLLLLDRMIPWQDVISWRWQNETVLAIEYLVEDPDNDHRIKQFTTFVPADERREIEMILKSKMDEFDEKRKGKLFKE
jgi:hypothetical protein